MDKSNLELARVSKQKDVYNKYAYYVQTKNGVRIFSDGNAQTLATYIHNHLMKYKDTSITLINNYFLPEEQIDVEVKVVSIYQIQKHIEYLTIMI
jgi:hypothetical protein